MVHWKILGEDAKASWKYGSRTMEKYRLKHDQHLYEAEATGTNQDVD